MVQMVVLEVEQVLIMHLVVEEVEQQVKVMMEVVLPLHPLLVEEVLVPLEQMVVVLTLLVVEPVELV
jgi:hypothetical protein|tara:strand:+ start:156 stop:356 length:201 start_codon:yes stop_codon:yes gene_type:complete